MAINNPKLLDFIKAANESLTRSEFKASFDQVKRMVRLAIEQLDARITARLSQVKDGYTPIKGKDYFDGKPGKTPVKGVDYFDGVTPVAGVHFPLPKDGDPGKNADVQEAVKLTLPQLIAEIDKRVPLLGDALRAGLEAHVKDLVSKFGNSGGGNPSVAVMQSGTMKAQAAATLNFKGAGAPTVTIGQYGVTHLDFPGAGGGGTKVRDENASGLTLAHTPLANTLQLFRGGTRQSVVNGDYTIAGAVISLTSALQAGENLTADYEY